MTDDDRKHMYEAMLRGLAQTAQDRLCAADEQHAWGPWTRYLIQQDLPMTLDPGIIYNQAVQIASTRKCENCGKVENA